MESPGARGLTRKPFGELTNNVASDEAITPTSNLTLLTRVASHMDRVSSAVTSKRELFCDPRDDDDHPTDMSLKTGFKRDRSVEGGSGQQENLTPSGQALFGPPKVSRKEKSLGLLCENFIKRYPEAVSEGEKCEIHLDDLAKSMATERRRIYDIVNVLEAVQMMTKVGKNLYQWHGTTFRRATLVGLRELALNLKLAERFHEVRATEENDLASLFSFTPPHAGGTPKGFSPFPHHYATPSPSSVGSGPSPSPAERQTSLGVACQKFLMLFLINPEPNDKINLEFAAKVIHGPVLPEAVMKTRIRRLYDIANILQSLQLIRKVQVTDQVNGCKKPAFEYIGPRPEDLGHEIFQTLPSTRQRNSLLGVGKNLTNIPDDEPRSEPMTRPLLHFKKRFNIAQHFNDDDEGAPEVGREHKIPRTQQSTFLAMPRSASFDDDDAGPQNLTTKRPAECSSSLVDLTARAVRQTSTSLSSSVSSSSSSFHSGIDWPRSPTCHFKKTPPLQVSPLLNANVRDPGAFDRWDDYGFGHSKTVIALVSPHHPVGGAFYPAVQTSPVSLVMRKSIIRD